MKNSIKIPKVTRWVFICGILLFIWLSNLNLDLIIPSQRSDASWKLALSHFHFHEKQYGTEVVFTYGPLGFLANGYYVPECFWEVLGWELIFKSLLMVPLAGIFFRLKEAWIRWVYLFVILFVWWVEFDAAYLFFLFAICFCLFQESFRTPLRMAGVICLAILSIVKGAFLFAAIGILICWLVLLIIQRRFLIVLAYLGLYLFALGSAWMFLGQSLLHLPAFFRGTWEVASGYSQAMGIPAGEGFTIVMVLASVSWVGFLFAAQANKEKRSAFWIENLSYLGIFFLVWKQSMVRADSAHLNTLFLFSLSTLFPVYLLKHTSINQKVLNLSFAVALGLAISGCFLTTGVQPEGNFSRAMKNGAVLLNLQEFKRNCEIQMADYKSRYGLPLIKQVIGKSSVDLLGFEQAVLLASELNYQSRPVFQSYSAYTRWLMEKNSDFFRGSNSAPEFVLMKYQAIDGRLKPLEDSLALREIYAGYHPMNIESGYVLFARNSSGAESTEYGREKRKGELNLELKLEAGNQEATWMRIHLKPSVWGRLRSLILRTPPVEITLKFSNGKQKTFRLVPKMAEQGFLVQPLILSAPDIGQCYAEKPGVIDRVQSFTVKADPVEARAFQNEFEFEISGIQGLFTTKIDEELLQKLQFPMFELPPRNVKSSYPLDVVETADGREMLVLFGNSAMEFEVSGETSDARFVFGMLPQGYGGPEKSDGIVFSVEFSSNQGTTTNLFTRYLNPAEIPGDRSLQSGTVRLPPDTGGKLIFRTHAGPRNDEAFDWCFWSDVRFDN